MAKRIPPTIITRKPNTIGYLRISTGNQELEKNKADILHLANAHDLGQVRFVEESHALMISSPERATSAVLFRPFRA